MQEVSLYISVFCVCGGKGRGSLPSWILKLFLFSLIYFSFFPFFDDIPPLRQVQKMPLSLPLFVMFICVCSLSLFLWLVCGWGWAVGVGVELVVNLISSPLLLSIQGYIYFYDCKEKNKMILSSIIKSLTDIFCQMK